MCELRKRFSSRKSERGKDTEKGREKQREKQRTTAIEILVMSVIADINKDTCDILNHSDPVQT